MPSSPAKPAVAVPQSSVRMVVRSFVLEGVVDHPDRGIKREELERMVESLRANNPNGFTISEMQAVTDEITRIYREAGYILARAFIPEQEVKDGRVTIKILEGSLEKISLQGNQRYSENTLSKPFEGLVDQPVNQSEIESALLLLNDYPGLRYSTTFSPGETQGTAGLTLSVAEEKWIEGGVWLDNHGSALTGENRVWADVSLNNPTGVADRLSAQVLKALEQNEGTSSYYALSYQRPFLGPRNVLGLEIGNNTFRVGGDFADLDLTGKSSTMTASARRSFLRSRKMNVEGRFALTTKRSSTDLGSLPIGEDALTVASLGSVVDYRDGWSGYTQAALHYHKGLAGVLGAMDENGDGNSSRTSASGEKAGGDFTKTNLQLTRWQQMTFHPLLVNQSLLMRAQFQFTSDYLVSMEQMSLGGPNSVRAYPPSERMADSGQFFSLEWIAKSAAMEGKFLEGLQISAFYDYASGKLNEPLANDVTSPKLQGFGGSVQISPQAKYVARLELAKPVGDPKPSNDRSIQYFLKFGYLF